MSRRVSGSQAAAQLSLTEQHSSGDDHCWMSTSAADADTVVGRRAGVTYGVWITSSSNRCYDQDGRLECEAHWGKGYAAMASRCDGCACSKWHAVFSAAASSGDRRSVPASATGLTLMHVWLDATRTALFAWMHVSQWMDLQFLAIRVVLRCCSWVQYCMPHGLGDVPEYDSGCAGFQDPLNPQVISVLSCC